MKAKNTGKSPEKRRRPVKRLVEISEDVYKLKLLSRTAELQPRYSV